MGRPRRAYVPGSCFHVFTRGHNRREVFLDDEDHVQFLRCVENACKKYETLGHGFALMKNHYHLLATPTRSDGLSETIKHFSGCYVRYFNNKYVQSGTLWNERHKSVPIKHERQLLTCLMYIERNPVAATIVPTADKYCWSSYRLHAYGNRIPWVTSHWVYNALGTTDADRQRVYRVLFDASLGV